MIANFAFFFNDLEGYQLTQNVRSADGIGYPTCNTDHLPTGLVLEYYYPPLVGWTCDPAKTFCWPTTRRSLLTR